METVLRKWLKLKSHLVACITDDPKERGVTVHIERLGTRRLSCGNCGQPCRRTKGRLRPRQWRDLALRDRQLILVYTPYRVVCPRCGVRVERIPWARRWQRITHALSGVVSALAKELPWNRVGRHYGLNWKCVASAVRRAVAWGRAHRPWKTLRAIGIDEVARARGQSYLTLVYDLERRRLIWIGKDRTRETAESFFRWLAKRRGRCIHTVCLDMWAPFADAVRANLPQAEIVFDRFHVVKHLNAAVDEVRRQTWRSLNRLDRKRFKRTRWLWLKNPWNLKPAQKRRLSELCRRNSPIVRAYYLKEDFQRFWDYVYQGCAEKHLKQWLWWASHSRLEPFKRFARMIRNHWDGLMSWTRTRVSNGALEGMNSNVALIRHRSRGFRNVDMFIDNIYHCCANLPTEPGTLSG